MCFVAFPVVSALGLNHRLSGWPPSGVPGRCSTGPGEAEMSSSLFCPFHHCIGIARVACAGGRNEFPSIRRCLVDLCFEGIANGGSNDLVFPDNGVDVWDGAASCKYCQAAQGDDQPPNAGISRRT